MQSKAMYLHLAKIKVLVERLRLRLRKSVSVDLLRDTLLVAHGACCEGRNGLVVEQVSTSNLQRTRWV